MVPISPRTRRDTSTAEKGNGMTHISKYAIERASSPIDSSAAMRLLSRVNNRRLNGSATVESPLGSGRVVVVVSGRSDPHGAFGVGEWRKTCRSIPAVAMTGNTGWMSVLLTIDRWP